MGDYPGDRNGYTSATIGPRLERMYRSGLSFDQMGARLGIDPRTVRYWLKKLNLGPTRKPLTDAQTALMVELWHNGLTQAQIGRRVGRCEKTVGVRLRALGIPTADRRNKTMPNIELKKEGNKYD